MDRNAKILLEQVKEASKKGDKEFLRENLGLILKTAGKYKEFYNGYMTVYIDNHLQN